MAGFEQQRNANRSAKARKKQQKRRQRDILICVLFLAVILVATIILLQGSQEPAAMATIPNTQPQSTQGTPAATQPQPDVDVQPPVLTGISDLTAYIGDTIHYRENITVTDDTDDAPVLQVDTSQVRPNLPGTYEITYIARDAAGNETTQTATLTLSKREDDVEASVRAQAKTILADITTDDMDDMQKAYAIYRWTLYNIGYTGRSDKSNWVVGAKQAFSQRAGDCYTYYSAAKALFDAAGIPNLCVVKSDTSHSEHYWNLINIGTGWYHVDCTPRVGDGDNFFMVTDAELEAYSVAHKNSHVYISEQYPERATQSVQNQINYSSSTLNR